MELFRFVNRHAHHKDDRQKLQRWWPYILRIHATATAMVAVGEGEMIKARNIIVDAIKAIEDLEPVDAYEFKTEHKRSLTILSDLAQQLSEMKPLSPVEKLERALQQAVHCEDYETAATLRDQIHAIEERQI